MGALEDLVMWFESHCEDLMGSAMVASHSGSRLCDHPLEIPVEQGRGGHSDLSKSHTKPIGPVVRSQWQVV